MTFAAAAFTFTFVFCSLVLLALGFKDVWRDVRHWQGDKLNTPQKPLHKHAKVQWARAAASKP